MPDEPSIFHRYFEPQSFVDRFVLRPEGALDVLIPAAHSNDLWRANLVSIYREIPVHRLLIGDGGCVDDTLATARDFPRVVVLDHRGFTSLGYSIRKLIEAVVTEWFVYLHSDVYLPPGWFDVMRKHQDRYDWFECAQRLTVLLDYPLEQSGAGGRAYSGSQMGRTAAFGDVLPRIDDDYLYRNEDIVIASLVERSGHTYGRVQEAFYYHQQMPRKSRWERQARVIVQPSREEEIRELTMQAKGVVKYLDPSPERAIYIEEQVLRLVELGAVGPFELDTWIARTNPRWIPLLHRERRRRLLVSAWQIIVSLKSCVSTFVRLLAGNVATRRARRGPETSPGP